MTTTIQRGLVYLRVLLYLAIFALGVAYGMTIEDLR